MVQKKKISLRHQLVLDNYNKIKDSIWNKLSENQQDVVEGLVYKSEQKELTVKEFNKLHNLANSSPNNPQLIYR